MVAGARRRAGRDEESVTADGQRSGSAGWVIGDWAMSLLAGFSQLQSTPTSDLAADTTTLKEATEASASTEVLCAAANAGVARAAIGLLLDTAVGDIHCGGHGAGLSSTAEQASALIGLSSWLRRSCDASHEFAHQLSRGQASAFLGLRDILGIWSQAAPLDTLADMLADGPLTGQIRDSLADFYV